MAAERAYLVGEAFAASLRDVVGRVRAKDGSQITRMGETAPTFHPPEVSHYLSKTTAAWDKGTTQTLTLWGGTPGSEAAVSGVTVEAWNYVANLPSGLWVVLSRANGSFYLAAFDYTGLSGYAASSQQVLAHNTSGQLVWLNTTACT